MKKIILLISILTCILSYNLKASNSDLFQYDENVITEKFQSLNNLELFVNQNQGVTLTEIKANSDNDGLVANLDKNGINYSFNTLADPPLGIPSFMWGCCFGWVGILIVYLSAEDPAETKKSLYGCLVNGGATVVFYVIYYAYLMSATTY